MNIKIKKQIFAIARFAPYIVLIVLLNSVAYATPRFLAGGGDTDEILMLAGETVDIEIYSDDTTMYTAFLYYEYDGGELVHDDLNSPTSEAGVLAQVFDLGDPYYAYEVDAVDFTGSVSSGIHFIFEYTATEGPGSYQLELYNDTFDIILDTLFIFIGVSEDIYPPTPDPMTWSSEPVPVNSTTISMTATTASDASGVEYFFDCVSGGGNDSGWQDLTTYTDSDLVPGTEYTYRVKARDKSENQNETQWSTEASVTPIIIYVDDDAGGLNNGVNWENAYTSLQAALDVAVSGNQIWVAAGTYYPTSDYGLGIGDRGKHFRMINEVALYGGFPTGGNWDDHDPNTYESILSGDIGIPDDPNDNCYHVFYHPYGTNLNSTAVLDGFTISAGNANGSGWHCEGGGIFNLSSSPTVTNCTFRENNAKYSGGGMDNHTSSPTVTGCTFIGNMAGYGCGMYNHTSHPSITNCVFSGNVADYSGGGMFNTSISRPTVTGCAFLGNYANKGDGGGMNNGDSSPTITDCSFSGNSAGRSGGGMSNEWGDPTVTDCTFSGNSAGNSGGGMDNEWSIPTVTDCTFSGNTAVYSGGGMSNTNEIIDELIGNRDDCSPTITNCTFSKNTSEEYGGGMSNWDYCNPNVIQCIFSGNHSGYGGGGVWNDGWHNNLMLSNCTFSYNSADYTGGIIYSYHSSCVLKNCLLWDNQDLYDTPIRHIGSGTITVSYSNIQAGWPGMGNIDSDPHLTADRHLRTGSVCINAGDPNFIVDPNVPNDIDGENRILAGRIEIGADEFLDTDGDGLPDFWEQRYFGGPTIADPNADPDGDGIVNLDEFELFSSDPNKPPLYVPGAYTNIQDAIDAANEGDTVLVTSGTYTGIGNKDLDFGGKAVVLYAPEGPSATIIDCENSGRALDFHSAETPASAVVGFTLTNGYAYDIDPNSAENRGGAIRCIQSSPQIRNCAIINNNANDVGGGIYGYLTSPVLADCTVSENDPNGIWMDNSSIRIEGLIQLAGNDWTGSNLMLYGDGTIVMGSEVTLHLSDSRIRCNVTGDGLIEVPLDTETAIEGLSHIELPDFNGGILCEGLLRIKDNAYITNTHVEVTRASFEGDVEVTNSVITAEAGSPYGQFFAEDSAVIQNNVIYADGDRYLDLDPAYLQDMIITNNEIHVLITEGVGNTRGGLFELRGDPNLLFLPDPNIYYYDLLDPNLIPEFDTQSWTIEELYLKSGAKVNLTNRFDFGNGGFDEVLYVKHLYLESDCQLNTAFNCLYFGDLIGDPDCIVNVPILGFSLNMIECDSNSEFVSRVVHNNYIDPENDLYDRIHVERVTGEFPDPNGMLKMTSLTDDKPLSPTEGQLINARAKGLFAKSSEQRILVWFEYLFNDPNTELAIYLSDVPELLDHNHPDRSSRYLEVARLKCPPSGRPGSPGSGRFGTFHQYVDKGTLDFIRGTRIELEFIGPEGSSIYINNWDPQVECSTEGDSVCKDVSGNTAVDTSDFLTVIGECGSAAVLLPDGINTRACLDGPFSQDGYVDAVDVISWDWITHLLLEGGLTTFCFDIPMTNETGGAVSTETYSQTNPLPLTMGPLLITGKKYSNSAYYYMQDCLYAFDEFSSYQDSSSISEGRLNGKLVSDPQGNMYQLNAELGLVNLSEETAVIAPEPNGFDIITEPRYHQEATVYVGLYGSQEQWFGRPILDVAFAPDFDSGTGSGFVYAVPVVVKPDLADPNLVYTAAAKLQVNGPGDYTVVKIFDEPPDPNDNQYRDALREIEIDRDGNVYVINSHELNESDILWRFRPDGSIKRIDLGIPDSGRYIPAPIGMCVSDSTNMLYLASSQDYEADPNCSQIYGFSLEDLDTISRTITIYDMHHITDITEDPASGDLWVSGFNMYNVPSGVPPVTGYPFYEPYLAQIPLDQNTVTAVHLDRSGYDLALPLSIIWTDSCGGADLDGNGQVGIGDLSVIADNWLRGDCDLGNHWCDGADLNKLNPVNMLDWKIFTDNWLNDCN
jgi:hypothetical protein